MCVSRIFCEDKQTFLQDYSDDGETAAGGRLLHLMEVGPSIPCPVPGLSSSSTELPPVGNKPSLALGQMVWAP